MTIRSYSLSVTDEDPLTGQTLDSGSSTLYDSNGAQDNSAFNGKATDPVAPTMTAAPANDTAAAGTTDAEQMTSDSAMGVAPVGLVLRYPVPDLVMREVKVEKIENGTATVSWQVENTMDASRAGTMTSTWVDRLYLSSDTSVDDNDTPLANLQGQNKFEHQSDLPAGGFYTRSEKVSLDLALVNAPQQAKPYLLVTANAHVEGSALRQEHNDGGVDGMGVGINNTMAFDLRPQPDAPIEEGRRQEAEGRRDFSEGDSNPS